MENQQMADKGSSSIFHVRWRSFDCEGADRVLAQVDCVHDGSPATDSARNVGQDQESTQEIIPLEDGRLAAFNLFVDQMK